MELTDSRVKCLLDGQKLNDLSEETFDQLINISVSHICGITNSKDLSNIYGSKPDIIKSAYKDVLRLLVEAAKYDSSSVQLNSLLRCSTLNPKYITKFCEIYENHKSTIQQCLESFGNSLPHIVDVDWRLDYCIKSNFGAPAETHVYIVSLSTIKHGSLENVKFKCTIQQLQELIYKLKDAARHTEKLASS
ncbi:COMM domain-containing protein 3 [Trichogramma pretiosum]|uniref:COMM domain-containing protein 3 n=1 Tax=Trichogramma pretiosum TaxID=7493 RepID=UPI0006C96062|nr:COMM domain-containing protein 3 [Trichogramma pretiosum]